jgi:hypothetical protein
MVQTWMWQCPDIVYPRVQATVKTGNRVVAKVEWVEAWSDSRRYMPK